MPKSENPVFQDLMNWTGHLVPTSDSDTSIFLMKKKSCLPILLVKYMLIMLNC